jgi:hypothetical protein
MSEHQFKTPVAFIIFNRPDTTAKVFEAIRRARPTKLLVAADGPRADRSGETEKCAAARAIIDKVDWPCDVFKKYSDVNLGCKIGPASGIDWVFEQVEEAIILEDDCVPHPDFFNFCEKMLDYYRHDTRVMMICGTNYLQNVPDMEESYYFANYYPIWGWASWRRAWKHFDVDIKAWEGFQEKKQLYWIFSHKEISKYYENMFALIRNGFAAWDIQWWFTCIFQHGLAIVPRSNLITNIGEVGTHTETQGNMYVNLPSYSLDVDHICHPRYVTPDIILNQLTYEYSHANLDLSIKSAWKKRRYRSVIKAFLPDCAIKTIRKVKRIFG